MVGVKNAHVFLDRDEAYVSELTGDDLGDHIYVGGDVWYSADKKGDSFTNWTIININATHDEDTVKIKSCDNDDKTLTDKILTVPRNELHVLKDDKAVIAEHVKKLAESGQGLRNLALVDPQPIVEYFAALWVPMYEKVLNSAVNAIDDFVRGAVAKAFACGRDMDLRTRRLVGLLERRATAGLDDLRRDADRCVARLVRYCKPPLAFTTNEHYLASGFQNVVSDLASEHVTDESSAMNIHAQWLAFRKVQSKVIIEAAAKDLIGIYMVDFDALVSDLLGNTCQADQAMLEAVDPAPLSRANERKRVVADLTTLDELSKAFETHNLTQPISLSYLLFNLLSS